MWKFAYVFIKGGITRRMMYVCAFVRPFPKNMFKVLLGASENEPFSLFIIPFFKRCSIFALYLNCESVVYSIFYFVFLRVCVRR